MQYGLLGELSLAALTDHCCTCTPIPASTLAPTLAAALIWTAGSQSFWNLCWRASPCHLSSNWVLKFVEFLGISQLRVFDRREDQCSRLDCCRCFGRSSGCRPSGGDGVAVQLLLHSSTATPCYCCLLPASTRLSMFYQVHIFENILSTQKTF